MDQAEGDKILMVSHGLAMKRFLTYLGYIKADSQEHFNNCTIIYLTYEKGQFNLVKIIEHDFKNLQIKDC